MLKFLLFVVLAFPARSAVAEPPAVAACAPSKNEALTLSDVLSLALCRNPQTAQAYMGALAAQEDLGTAKAAYYPTVDFKASLDESGSKILRIAQEKYPDSASLIYECCQKKLYALAETSA